MQCKSRKGVLFCLVGPAGSGKSTLAEKLLKVSPNLKRSVSVTSRPIRPGEQDGIDYHFVSKDEFKRKQEAGEFFEFELVHGNYYGTLRSTLESAIREGGDLLLVIDIRGAINVRKAYPSDSFLVFVVPPDFETLRERLTARVGSSSKEVEIRLQTAKVEFEQLVDLVKGGGGMAEYVVLNDTVPEATRVLEGILTAERARLSRQRVEELQKIGIGSNKK